MKKAMTANDGGIHSQRMVDSPDTYNPAISRIPPENFVVTRDKNGTMLSLYGDLVWDRTPYNPEGRLNKLHFTFWTNPVPTARQIYLTRETRWLMFILIHLRPGKSLSNRSLQRFCTLFKAMARHCELHSLRIAQLLADPAELLAFNADRQQQAKLLFTLLNTLRMIGPEVVGLDVVGRDVSPELLKAKRKWLSQSKQYPPIPTRIYSEFISNLTDELSDVEQVIDGLLGLYKEYADDPLTGLTTGMQYQKRKSMGIRGDGINRPTFADLLRKYGLEKFWEKKNYSAGVRGLSRALTEALITASWQIQAFTGMRINEVEALSFDCLDEVRRSEDNSLHFIVNGRVTKLTSGKIKRVQWVTSKSGRDAVLLAQRISNAVYSAQKNNVTTIAEPNDKQYLFISPGYGWGWLLCTNTPLEIDWGRAKELRDRIVTSVITESDLQELEQIDPHRAWRSEDAFRLGQTWVFTTHQLRRSLALYAQRSGLVSLPSLRRQLQHITREMSAYYARGSNFAKDFIGDENREKHIGDEWQEAQPISQYLSYVAHVLFADERDFFGAHPNWIDHRLRDKDGFIIIDREATRQRFRRGEIAYQPTVIGGCVKVGECDKNPLDLLHLECLTSHCKNMIGSKSKLEKVIQIQTNLVEKLKNHIPQSVEYRMESNNLKILTNTLNSLI